MIRLEDYVHTSSFKGCLLFRVRYLYLIILAEEDTDYLSLYCKNIDKTLYEFNTGCSDRFDYV